MLYVDTKAVTSNYMAPVLWGYQVVQFMSRI